MLSFTMYACTMYNISNSTTHTHTYYLPYMVSSSPSPSVYVVSNTKTIQTSTHELYNAMSTLIWMADKRAFHCQNNAT